MSHIGDIKPLLEFFAGSGINHFVETGTYTGETALLASSMFGRVDTIEVNPAYYAIVATKFAGRPNIHPMLGNSRQCLTAAIVFPESQKRLYWLDAHWWYGVSETERSDQCPLLDELGIINKLDAHACIMIDDADFFFRPPPRPYDASQWPSLDGIFRMLLEYDRYIAIHGNVIVAVPRHMKDKLSDWLRGEK